MPSPTLLADVGETDTMGTVADIATDVDSLCTVTGAGGDK